MQYDTFISYRRKSGAYQATALKETLKNRGHKEKVSGRILSELSDKTITHEFAEQMCR